MKLPSLEEITKALDLSPLPKEGGLYRQTYITKNSTAIYYLLNGDAFSHFHKLAYDEVYHFYLGDPVCLVELLPDESVKQTILGSDVLSGETVQHVVKAGNWQGSCLCSSFPGIAQRSQGKESCGYALLGTTMSPPYSDDCYLHGDRQELLRSYPEGTEAIQRLTLGTDPNVTIEEEF